MFRCIMVPVDLAHVDRLEKALAVSAELARSHEAELVYVGVTGTAPSSVARTFTQFEAKLTAFARSAAERLGVRNARSTAIRLHDVTVVAVDLDRALIAKAREIGADLVVMGSHVPGAMEHLISSNAGYVAAHAPMSVFVVRS